jgi:hypothetical protein
MVFGKQRSWSDLAASLLAALNLIGVKQTIIRDWGNIENAVTKAPERDGGVADIGMIREHNLQNCDVTDHWG